ncbi:MAG TPA: thiolase family protein [Candidatus Binatia bacterium]
MNPVYISGVGMTKFGKNPRSLAEICCQAAAIALADSDPQAVDAIYIGAMNPEEFTGDSNIASQIVDALGLTGIPAIRVETASSAGAAAVFAGFQAIASGCYRRVLVLAGEKMTHLSTSATTRILAEVIDKRERQCGATMPALAAMVTEKYRQKFRLSESRLENMLCAVALKNHLNGAKNPTAQFQNAISRDIYLASKHIATPLRLYDCAPITDGAAALVLSADKTDVRISGVGQGTGPLSLRERDVFTSFPATLRAAERAYAMAQISPQDIDFAEVHDAFTPFEIITTEDLGFFPPGKGGEAVLRGDTAIDGRLPVNPSGGLKARGHPVGASGLAQVVEATITLRGQGPLKREVKRGITQSTGGLATNNFVTILERTDAPPVTHLWTPPLTAPPIAHRKQRNARIAAEGVIETFTILYVTPDGFLPPLALALVRDRHGELLMAQGEDETQLKIGQDVYLRRLGGVYYFTVKSQIEVVQQAFMKLFRRKPAKPAQNSQGSPRK